MGASPLQPVVLPIIQPGPPPQASIRAVVKITRSVSAKLSVDPVGGSSVSLGALRKGDDGAVIEIVVIDKDGIVDLSSASSMEFVFGRPISGFFVRPAVRVTDGTDGKIKYKTAGGEIDQVGEWRLQARVQLATFEVLTTETAVFSVEPVIDLLA